MDLLLTEAAERAFREAARWSSQPDRDELEAAALLLGLLAESECRAAIHLNKYGVDEPLVRTQWPNLVRHNHRILAWQATTAAVQSDIARSVLAVRRPSYEVKLSVVAAASRLKHLAQPLQLSTEHLLLGLVAVEHDVGLWLRERGVTPDAVLCEIHRQQGLESPDPSQTPAPLECPDDLLSASPEHPPMGAREDDSVPATVVSPSGQSAATDFPVGDTTAVLRILDAAADRAREGLRVVEDYVRFVLDDRHLTALLKQTRHELTAWLARFPWEMRVASRDTLADVGTVVTTPSESVRLDTTEVVRANLARLQEALRSLEEFGKVLDPAAAAGFERLRYRTYTLEKAIHTTSASLRRPAGASLRRPAGASLYVLLDGGANAADFQARLDAIVGAGADVVQLRDKSLDDRTLLERARRLCSVAAEAGVLSIINDRPELAVLAGADGVHVGQNELRVKDARRIVGPNVLVGVSTHEIAQARQAVLDGADYLGAGPTFPSGTKKFTDFPGLDYLRQLAAEIRLPAFAIGGIDATNLAMVLATGVRRIAVSGAVTASPDPAEAVRQLKAMLSAASSP